MANTATQRTHTSPQTALYDYEAIVLGAGVSGIYQIKRLIDLGVHATVLDANGGVGGTWWNNRYPGARFDSESYTYAYLFSKELFAQWQWQEHFAEQPETERYLNHVVDRFDLRASITFGARVVSAVFDESISSWTVIAHDGRTFRARYIVAATGVLSIPFIPEIPGRETFRGESHHTGHWPTTPVEFAGKRVAVIGTASSGVQVIPCIAGEVASLTVYQRTANWCTPLNNSAITAEEQRELQANFESMRETLNTSVAGFLHQSSDRAAYDDTPEERLAFFEQMWNSPGFSKLSSHYTDLLFNDAANQEWCDFIVGKIRSIVHDSETATKLIPKNHKFGERRPPFVTNYFEVYNQPNVTLVDTKRTPILSVTETGITSTDGLREFDIIIWATGFDFGTGALTRMGIVGRDGIALADSWADGPTTFLGVQCHGFPNLFFPGGPHAAAGNNPRYNGDQVDFIHDAIVFARDSGYDTIEVESEAEQRWTNMVDKYAKKGPFSEASYFFGTNIPGKPRKYLLNSGGRPKLFSTIAEVKANHYTAFLLSRSVGE